MLTMDKNSNLLTISEEVKDALKTGKPIVALESTVICHGLPYPKNKETALKIEQAVRDAGSIPATIGIENGKFLIGMTADDIERFASSNDVPKVSSRDIPIILAKGIKGATTVASSIVAADLAGIKFFASAGIGGVHRGAETTMDVSADLVQFTRSKVAVVCAGAKSILDLGLTMEYLETQCVPIVSYKSDDFPAFYCESSGHKSPHRLDDAREVAVAVEKHWELGNNSSMLITHPIAKEDAIASEYIEGIINQAVLEADEEGVSGPQATPVVMRKVGAATKGKTVEANMSVLISTAAIAGEIAKSHAEAMTAMGVAA